MSIPHEFIEEQLRHRVKELERHVQRLTTAIRTHRDEHGDDRCWMDDERLYEVLGDGIKHDRRVGCQLAMAANCIRFIKNRTEGGHWPTYAELEQRVKDLTLELGKVRASQKPTALGLYPQELTIALSPDHPDV